MGKSKAIRPATGGNASVFAVLSVILSFSIIQSNNSLAGQGSVAAPFVGGGTVTTGYPPVVRTVALSADKNSKSSCTAAFIAPQLLLTAGHCVCGISNDVMRI